MSIYLTSQLFRYIFNYLHKNIINIYLSQLNNCSLIFPLMQLGSYSNYDFHSGPLDLLRHKKSLQDIMIVKCHHMVYHASLHAAVKAR